MTNLRFCGLNAVGNGSANCAMMGLQATTTALAGSPPPQHAPKRRIEAATAAPDAALSAPTPAKTSRWEAPPPKRWDSPAPPATDDCIARLRAVAESAWAQATPTSPQATPTAGLAAPTADGRTVLSDDDFEDDEFEDELEEEGGATGGGRLAQQQQQQQYGNSRYSHHPHHHHHHQQQQQQQHQPPDYWPQQQYYAPPPQQQQQQQQATAFAGAHPPQQTIRREANGKSYLELGPAPRPPPPPPPPPQAAARRCCGRWCRPAPCYRQRRLAVLNLSVCKLARYRQCSDPSLRRSVLICNTLRRLEREMESEPAEAPYPSPPDPAPPARLAPPPDFSAYEQQLRDLAGQSGRATPFPAADDGDSGVGSSLADDGDDRPINWGSVLSLSSQTGVEEPLNNNELYAELGLDAWKERDEWEGLVAVGGT